MPSIGQFGDPPTRFIGRPRSKNYSSGRPCSLVAMNSMAFSKSSSATSTLTPPTALEANQSSETMFSSRKYAVIPLPSNRDHNICASIGLLKEATVLIRKILGEERREYKLE